MKFTTMELISQIQRPTWLVHRSLLTTKLKSRMAWI